VEAATWSWAGFLVLTFLAGAVLYWLLVISEGTFLGASVVALMYNWVARRYDSLKQFDADCEELFLRQPMLRELRDRPNAWVLDVATGTGRVPWVLSLPGGFGGRIVGLDSSREMLCVAAEKDWASAERRPLFIWQNAMVLPFADERFDLVSSLEAMEFMPRPEQVLEEMVRVTRSGGALVLTRRRGWAARLMLGKGWSKERLLAELFRLGLESSRVVRWQMDYDLVWARKPERTKGGIDLDPKAELMASIFCPKCREVVLVPEVGGLHCDGCHRRYRVATDGVVELARPV
jgi:SAM-dependent methyltransferase